MSASTTPAPPVLSLAEPDSTYLSYREPVLLVPAGGAS